MLKGIEVSYSDSIYFENNRSMEARLFRAIDSLVPESVEKILAKGNVIIQNDEWDALRVVADKISLPYLSILDNKKYEEKYSQDYNNGLNILEQLLLFGAVHIDDCSCYSALEIFTEKGLVDYVELCLKYGLKFSLNELYVVCKYADLSLFKLFEKYGFDFKYNQPRMKYFSDCPIEMLYEEPQKNTWGRIKSLDGFLEDKTISISASLSHNLEKLIYKKNNLCATKQEQKQCSNELNELQKEHYYDRLVMMKVVLKLIKDNCELLKNESIEDWERYISNYEDELKECFESSSSKSKKVMIKDIRTLVINYYCKEKLVENNILSDDDVKFIIRVYSLEEVTTILSPLGPKIRTTILKLFDLHRNGHIESDDLKYYLNGIGFDSPKIYQERKDELLDEVIEQKRELFDKGLVNKLIFNAYLKMASERKLHIDKAISKSEEHEIKSIFENLGK